MDLNTLQIFVKTVEMHSFTKAAAGLLMTQSGVSRAVSRLESDLGIKLLNRTTRSLSLTPDGKAFYDRVSLLLREIDDAEQQLVAGREQPKGTLKLSAPVGYGRTLLLPALSGLAKEYPSLVIELSLTDRMVDLTEEGYDAAIRVGEIPDSRLVAKQLGIIQLKTVASSDYLARFGTPAHIEDLDHHNCLNLRYPRTGKLFKWRFRENGELRELQVTGNTILDMGEGLVDLAIQGLGILQTQKFMVAQALAKGKLVPILEDVATTRGPLSLIYPQSRQLSSKVCVLRNALDKLDI